MEVLDRFIFGLLFGAVLGLALLLLVIIGCCILTWSFPVNELWILFKDSLLYMMGGFSILCAFLFVSIE